MSARRVLVLGAGRRVTEAVLPALRAAASFELAGVVARRARTLHTAGGAVEVGALDALTPAGVESADLAVVAVAKQAVPAVLERLIERGGARLDLLIDTPVLLARHLGRRRLLEAFRSVSVAEDTIALPCWDPVRRVAKSGVLGPLRRVVFLQSAWAYHGFAMAKALLGEAPIKRARRRRLEGPYAWRTARLANGTELLAFEPRDYAAGRILVAGTQGSVADWPQREEHQLLLEAVITDHHCTAFRVGDVVCELETAERDLMGPVQEGPGVARLMEPMKRVGFLRLLHRLAAGRAAYPVEQALDDSVADWHLERFGHYLSNPLTSPRSRASRRVFGLLSRMA